MPVQDILRNTPEKVTPSGNARAERALKLFEERGHLIRSVASDTNLAINPATHRRT
jgi:hypothetical protein